MTNDLYRSSTFATLSTIFSKTYDSSKLSFSIGHKPAFRITIISNPFQNVVIETTSLTFCLLCFFDLIIELSCFILLSKSQDLLGFAAVCSNKLRPTNHAILKKSEPPKVDPEGFFLLDMTHLQLTKKQSIHA